MSYPQPQVQKQSRPYPLCRKLALLVLLVLRSKPCMPLIMDIGLTRKDISTTAPPPSRTAAPRFLRQRLRPVRLFLNALRRS